jgi:hypothetical protein
MLYFATGIALAAASLLFFYAAKEYAPYLARRFAPLSVAEAIKSKAKAPVAVSGNAERISTGKRVEFTLIDESGEIEVLFEGRAGVSEDEVEVRGWLEAEGSKRFLRACEIRDIGATERRKAISKLAPNVAPVSSKLVSRYSAVGVMLRVALFLVLALALLAAGAYLAYSGLPQVERALSALNTTASIT